MRSMRIATRAHSERASAARPTLVDEIMPVYEVASRHSRVVRAPAATVYAELRQVDFGQSPLVRVLFALRGLPARLLGGGRRPAPGTQRQGVPPGFVLLAERPGREVVLGIAGQFWRPTGNVARLADAAAWHAYQAPGTASGVLVLRVTPIDYQTSRLTTETRVQVRGRGASLRFRAYWLIIGPFSDRIRHSLLRQISRAAEQATGLFRLTP
jgi:hypothetical protein